ncbi:TetR/AcrR family transcriptional regulator [Rhodococcus sp. 077-4]|uniref:TetR/AcrR family transcriptional regulator n=1 Tax=Rhodococcus sp. 077-4 TaxID=2789271 RepID=UPI0039F547AB
MPPAHAPDVAQIDDEPVPERLIRAAIELLAESGPSELKVRRITDGAGVSTIAVYHHFGGLQELLQAVVIRGYAALRTALVDASEADLDVGAQLFAMALSTREMAQQNAHLYDMMFGLSTRGTYRYVASADRISAEGFGPAYAVLAATCERLARISDGATPLTGEQIAAELWSLVHGFVTLEASGHFVQLTDPVSEVLQPMAVNHFVGMGFARDLAEHSAEQAKQWWARSRSIQH